MFVGASRQILSHMIHLIDIFDLFIANTNLIQRRFSRFNDSDRVDVSFVVEIVSKAQLLTITAKVVELVDVETVSIV